MLWLAGLQARMLCFDEGHPCRTVVGSLLWAVGLGGAWVTCLPLGLMNGTQGFRYSTTAIGMPHSGPLCPEGMSPTWFSRGLELL